MRRRLASSTAMLLLAGVLTAAGVTGTASAATAEPAPPPTDYDSPYVAAFDAQLPTGDPFAPPRNTGEAATRLNFRKEYQSGVRWSYTWVPWSSIEKTQGVYDFADLDNYVGWARAEGILLKLQVMTGDWSRPQPWAVPLRQNPDHPGVNVPAVDLKPAVDFWAALVKRYMPGGDLARQRGWDDGYGVRRWEMENEPSCLPWWGTWGRVPKDFSAFAALVSPRIHAIDPLLELSGPALSQNDHGKDDQCANGGIDGLPWMREALDADMSEWSSTTYREAATKPALGPYLDALSWHYDNISLTDGTVPARAKALRAMIDEFSRQATYPTSVDLPLWYSEGSALAYNSDPAEFATAQVQLMAILHASGNATMNLEPGTQINEDAWKDTPMYGAQRALTTYLPRAGEVTLADDEFDPAKVTAFRRVEPATGARTYVVWAKDVGTGPVGPEIDIKVPVRTATADVVSSTDWVARTVSPKAGHVVVKSRGDDPSPVVIVAERARRASAAPGVRATPAGADAPSALPATGGASALPLAGLALFAAALGRHRRKSQRT